ncbi:MAG: hypothetical protein H7210_10320 [Pyrinomonadaceae bacterium]|nr:hypothetical protein [Phycisphaerales bacterium]
MWRRRRGRGRLARGIVEMVAGFQFEQRGPENGGSGEARQFIAVECADAAMCAEGPLRGHDLLHDLDSAEFGVEEGGVELLEREGSDFILARRAWMNVGGHDGRA